MTTTSIDAVAVGDPRSDGTIRDWDITSFDGTVIRTHWFPLDASADEPAPTILMGPGWGSPGDVDENTVGLLGALTIGSLRDAGYNVVTWDPRGFGASTGTVQIDSPDYEARDVQQLIDWLATQPEAQLDADGDPRMGMIGGSYGGGIQLVTAAIDCRPDALVPIVAWNSLTTSLYKADTFKAGWSNLLAAAAMGADVDPTITRATEAGNTTGVIDPADMQWFADRGPADLVSDITVPTLIIQGTVDTLFTLDEGVSNHQLLDAAGVPTGLLWFCGGHGACLSTDAPDEARVGGRAIAWLDHYVKGDEAADIGEPFEFVDQNGVPYTMDHVPSESEAPPIMATGSGTLALVAEGGSGPVVPPAGADVIAQYSASIIPAPATNAVNVTVGPAPAEGALVVGPPELTVTYSGTTSDGVQPTRVFAQLVDEETGLVVGNQVTPIAVVLDGTTHTTTVPLEMVAHLMVAGSTLTLQIVATTVAYGVPRLGGSVDFEAIDISLPVVTSAMAVAG